MILRGEVYWVDFRGSLGAEIRKVRPAVVVSGDEADAEQLTPIAIADNLPVDLAVDLLTKLITERGGVPKIPSRR